MAYLHAKGKETPTVTYKIHHPSIAGSVMTGKSASLDIGKLYISMMRRDTSLKDRKCHVSTLNVYPPVKMRKSLKKP